VLFIQQAVVLGISTLLALGIAISTVLVSGWRLSGFVVSIPWLWLSTVVASVYIAAIGAMLVSSRRIRAGNRRAT
jgi:hypothetical protein